MASPSPPCITDQVPRLGREPEPRRSAVGGLSQIWTALLARVGSLPKEYASTIMNKLPVGIGDKVWASKVSSCDVVAGIVQLVVYGRRSQWWPKSKLEA